MPSTCFILKVHEPPRLRHYSFFDIGESASYTDEASTRAHLDTVTHQCYLPATQLLLQQIKEYKGDFRLAILLSGVTLDQFARFQPLLLAQFKHLADTGCVEFIGEPYFHSLTFLFSKPEFRAQLDLHRQKLRVLFGHYPDTFHDHGLCYNNDLAFEAQTFGFKVVLATGTGRLADGRSLNRLYQPAPYPALKLLLTNPLLADAITRASPTSGPSKKPLTAASFVSRLAQQQGEVITLSCPLNAFAEHPSAKSLSMEFLSQFPGVLLANSGLKFETPSQTANANKACESVSIPGFACREEGEKDAQEWMGNEMQKDAINGLYLLEQEVKAHPDPAMLLAWRHLQVSDHFLFMNTKSLGETNGSADASPYRSPYDAYINFMNILTDFSERLALR